MSERVYNCLQRLPLIKKRIHECSDKLKASDMILLHFVRYWQHLELDIAVKGPVYWRETFNFELHSAQLPDNMFRRLYRLSKKQMRLLTAIISDDCIRSQKRLKTVMPAIGVETMLCVSMRLLAGASYLDVSWPYGISVSSVYEIFQEVLTSLDRCLKNICFPKTEAECRRESLRFISKRRSPITGIIAALDGVAVAIEKPSTRDVSDPKKYRNRKNFFAILVQAAVTADYKFVFVSATHAGGTHDSTAFQASSLQTLVVSRDLPQWAVIVADDAYQNTLHVVTPYSGRSLPVDKDSFNFFHSSCRMTVEQVFGMLVQRFGIFWSHLRTRLKKSTTIIGVTCKIHNFIIDNAECNEFEVIPSHEENNVEGVPNVFLQNSLYTDTNIIRARHNRTSENRREEIRAQLQAGGHLRP